jgi:hypothetical protein
VGAALKKCSLAAETGGPFRLALARITADIGVNRCQLESGPGRYAHQALLAKSFRTASRGRTIWKVFCVTRRPRLSATKGHAPEGVRALVRSTLQALLLAGVA